MIKSSIKFTLIAVTALAIATVSIQASDKAEKADKPEPKANGVVPGKSNPSKGEKSNKAIPFHGSLSASSDATITVGTRVFQVNSETKIKKNGKPAALADGEIGKEVAGQYREEDGKLVAKSIRFGPKPTEAGEKKQEGKPAGKHGETKPAEAKTTGEKPTL